jgi:3-deoxy-D-manno-octulosonic-acid transferase
MIIRGKVSTSAHGTARARNAPIADLLYRALPDLRGYDLGTLNVELVAPAGLKIKALDGPGRVAVSVPQTRYEWRRRPIPAEKIAFLPIEFSLPGRVSRRPGYLYLPSGSSRPEKGILELMSRENLRGTRGVKDGDAVEIFLPDNAGAPGERGQEGRSSAFELMMIVVYGILFALSFLLSLPYLLFRLATTRRFRVGLDERFGLYGETASALASSRSIWVQAASVGEVSAALPLVRLLQETFPDHRIVVTCQTATGRQAIREKLAGVAVGVLCPLDFPPLVFRLIRLISPRLLVLIETEIWPGMILSCARREIPIALVNGRLSRRSSRAYRRFSRPLRPVLRRIARFNMRTEEDARRMKRLGTEPALVRVLGNIKFDSLPPAEIGREESRALFARIGLAPGDLLLIGGSTFAGEEEILLRIYRELKARFPRLRLLLAPRHLERVGALRDAVNAAGETCRLFSADVPSAGAPVIVLDRMGALFSLYSLAAAVFIGRSLVGRGGQNPIEPAVWSVPVLFGPRMENFRDIARALLDGGGAIRVGDEADLSAALADLLADPARRRDIGAKGRAVVESRRGATRRNLESLRELLRM